MTSKKELKNLARIKTSPAPVITCYLNCDQTDEKQLEKSRIFLKNFLAESKKILPAGSKEFKGFKKDAEKIKKEFENILGDTSTRGLVIFACSQADCWKVLRSPIAVKSQARLSDAAYLVPLVKINEELLRAVFVRLDPKEAEIIIERQGEVEAREKIEQYFPDRVDAGGWSQMRFQRHIEKHLERNLKKVYKILKEVIKDRRVGYLFLIGEEELRRQFEKILPPALLEIKQEGFSAAPDASLQDIFDKTFSEIDKREKEKEKQVIKTILDSQKGRTALGNVLRAANRGKIRLLAIDEGYSAKAFQCAKSGMLFTSKQDCPGKGESLREVELEVELIRRALLQDAEIEVVSENDKFKQQGGLGVIVRY